MNNCSSIDGLHELKGSEFFLDGYVTLGEPKEITMDDCTYILQCYQGNHADEYTMKKGRTVHLFQNGVLKMAFEEDNGGYQIGEFTRFENGCAAFVQSFDEILDHHNFNRIVNHVRGERMEIYSHTTGRLIYHGEFNENRKREGWGIQYDEKTGDMLLEGMWKNNKLVQIIRKIEGTIMIEFKENGDNTSAINRIPIYVGGFIYDEEKESFIRNGRGYWINEKTRIATREVEWKDGVEVSGRDLYDGWYTACRQMSTISSIKELNNLNMEVTDLVISSNCCNDVDELDLSKFGWLRSIEIGDDCFRKVKTFRIDGMNQLKSLRIGKNCFTKVKQKEWDANYEAAEARANDSAKSFYIVNCESLERIEIGQSSFADFGGEFELKKLASLQTLKIGDVENKSWNFDLNKSFVLQGFDSCDL